VKGKREPEGAQRFTGLKKGLTDKHYANVRRFFYPASLFAGERQDNSSGHNNKTFGQHVWYSVE
jgi:hypothetical protein